MNSDSNMPIIGIVGEINSVTIAIVESALTTQCYVNLITEASSLPNEFSNLENNKLFKLSKPTIETIQAADYLIYVSSFIEQQNADGIQQETESSNLKLLNLVLQKTAKRSLIIFPYNQSPVSSQNYQNFLSTLKEYESVGYVLIGDTFGPGMPLNDNYFLGKVFQEIISGGEVSVQKSERLLYPIYSQLASAKIIHNLFSFGPFNSSSVSFVGEPTSISLLLHLLDSAYPNLQFGLTTKTFDYQNPTSTSKQVIEFDRIEKIKSLIQFLKRTRVVPINAKPTVSKPIQVQTADLKLPVNNTLPELALKNTKVVQRVHKTKKTPTLTKRKEVVKPALTAIYSKLKSAKKIKRKQTKLKKAVPHKKTKKRKISNKFVGFAFLLTLVFSSPFLLLMLSVLGLNTTVKLAKSNKLNLSYKVASATSVLTANSSDMWLKLTKLPVIGQQASVGYRFSELLSTATQTGIEALKLYQNVVSLVEFNGLSFKIDNQEQLGEIKLQTEKLYNNLSWMLTQVNGFSGLAGGLISEFSFESLAAKALDKASFAKDMTVFTEELLGFEGRRTYLIIFQNNMELRPTGGFIGSLGLVSFQDGQMLELNIMDVYSVDGQLNGYVKPPEPVVNYLNEPSWFLRDANWDPDFEDSSNKIMWFLDKSINQKVDGVLAVDLEFAKRMLDITGPLYLADHNLTINSSNFYEIIQKQVEEEFFPGSRNKANLLTSFSRQLMLKLTEGKDIQPTKLVETFVDLFEEKHMIIYAHNPDIQRVLDKQGWTGRVLGSSSCGPHCVKDTLSVVDANVGVNKANYYVDKTIQINKEVTSNSINSKVIVTFNNSGNAILAEDQTYKSYLRLVAPRSVRFDKVQIRIADNISYQTPETSYKEKAVEAGVYFELPKAKTATVTYEYSQDINFSDLVSGRYELEVIKQPGTYQDNMFLTLRLPDIRKYKFYPDPSLTQNGVFGYNTLLDRDKTFEVEW